ncbi:hemerythrin superfamily protein [Nocardioides zeae]|uniref:Hemerythrin superfamily protein n=1 Tax=Nocardioides zeae TaxID=1457234 RepID=A0ACC6IGJ1_9ACTN|nr:hemerythrin domain-containing protein [Nocardioides zeae]MDR6172758.1 hemerythrin superfamily protein [Nocardioides zeae]MDR6209768.1 hemerythrin superfamily protein [Nocardioides zeae]
MSARSIAEQSEAELGGRWSILVRQQRDHVDLDRLLRALEAAPPAGPVQEEVLHQVARLVFPHAFAEESVIWPAARRVLPDGEALTLTVEEEHQEVNELWSALERDRAATSTRRDTVARLVTVLREDVRDEEDVLLPRLQAALPPRSLRALGLAWEAVRRTAPTRPHPVVARRPPGNALAALPLTVLDRTRDVLDTRARRGGPDLAPHLRRASEVLAGAAGWVETSPVLRYGDRPPTHR